MAALVGCADWSTAALYQIGHTYESFARSLRASAFGYQLDHAGAIRFRERLPHRGDSFGYAAAAVALVKKLGGQILEVGFLIELKFLDGRSKLKELNVRSLVTY